MTWTGCVTLFVSGINLGIAWQRASVLAMSVNLVVIALALAADHPRFPSKMRMRHRNWYPRTPAKKIRLPVWQPASRVCNTQTPPCTADTGPLVELDDGRGGWTVKRSKRGYSDC